MTGCRILWRIGIAEDRRLLDGLRGLRLGFGGGFGACAGVVCWRCGMQQRLQGSGRRIVGGKGRVFVQDREFAI